MTYACYTLVDRRSSRPQRGNLTSFIPPCIQGLQTRDILPPNLGLRVALARVVLIPILRMRDMPAVLQQPRFDGVTVIRVARAGDVHVGMWSRQFFDRNKQYNRQCRARPSHRRGGTSPTLRTCTSVAGNQAGCCWVLCHGQQLEADECLMRRGFSVPQWHFPCFCSSRFRHQ